MSSLWKFASWLLAISLKICFLVIRVKMVTCKSVTCYKIVK